MAAAATATAINMAQRVAIWETVVKESGEAQLLPENNASWSLWAIIGRRREMCENALGLTLVLGSLLLEPFVSVGYVLSLFVLGWSNDIGEPQYAARSECCEILRCAIKNLS